MKFQYLKDCQKERQRIEYFKDVLPNVDWPLQTYKSEFIKQWEDAVTKRSIRPLKASTVLRDYSLLSSFLTGASWIRSGLTLIQSKRYENLKKPDNRERRVEEHELEKMLIALKYKPGTVPETKMQEVALIWLIALATGMRSGEIVNRLPRDIVLANRYVQLDDTKMDLHVKYHWMILHCSCGL